MNAASARLVPLQVAPGAVTQFLRFCKICAGMAELADAADSKSAEAYHLVGVRPPLPAPLTQAKYPTLLSYSSTKLESKYSFSVPAGHCGSVAQSLCSSASADVRIWVVPSITKRVVVLHGVVWRYMNKHSSERIRSIAVRALDIDPASARPLLHLPATKILRRSIGLSRKFDWPRPRRWPIPQKRLHRTASTATNQGTIVSLPARSLTSDFRLSISSVKAEWAKFTLPSS